MTLLAPITDPYASVRVAVYEPFVTTWASVPGMEEVLTSILERAVAARDGDVPGGSDAPTAMRFRWRPEEEPDGSASGAAGGTTAAAAPVANVAAGARARALPPEEAKRRADLVAKLRFAPELSLDDVVAALDEGRLPHLVALPGLRSILSPIGIAHLYRQLYFDAGAGIGPIEHAFTLAPLEQMEVVQEVTRRESIERTEIFGSETTLEKSAEQTTTDEITDQVQSSMRRDLQVGLSATAGGSVGVWSGTATASVDLGQSSERARETATTRAITETKKASEILRKTYSLTVKTYTELNERSSVKRTIRNDTTTPVSYGLRRVMRTIRVKLQSLGPRLVWQTYVRAPGRRLALGRMVMFRDADPPQSSTAPTAPPRPASGTETATQQVRAQWKDFPTLKTFVLGVAQDPLRTYAGLTITAVTNTAPDGDSSPPGVVDPTSVGVAVTGANGQVVAVEYTFDLKGDGWAFDVEYVISYDPSPVALELWQEQVRAAQATWDAQRADEAFERARRAITARSRIRPRPPADLRDEERYELTERVLGGAFGHLAPATPPSPVEIELFHRYLEVPSLFYWVHPSWWLPRAGVGRDDYEVTEDSEPAPFGRSLGWLIQLDGDRRRNEFLNSPWVRVCIPLRPGVERDALAWLARHVEGGRGFDLAPDASLGALVGDVESRRAAEGLAAPGPDYVTLDGQIPIGRDAAAAAYPVVDEFSVTVPTDGFLYDSLTTG